MRLKDLDPLILHGKAHVAREKVVQMRPKKLETPTFSQGAALGMIDVVCKIVA